MHCMCITSPLIKLFEIVAFGVVSFRGFSLLQFINNFPILLQGGGGGGDWG